MARVRKNDRVLVEWGRWKGRTGTVIEADDRFIGAMHTRVTVRLDPKGRAPERDIEIARASVTLINDTDDNA